MNGTDEVGRDRAMGPPPSTGRPRASGPRIFLVAFVVFFGAGAIWSAMVPLLGAPDEPSQIVKAAAVAHGTWTAVCWDDLTAKHACVPNKPQSALGFEAIPSFYALVRAADPVDNGAHSQICFHSQANATKSAACARSLNRSPNAYDISHGTNKYAWTYAARYPPLYYLVVGLPTYFGGSTIDLYLMRLVSALLAAIFLALAFTVVTRYSHNRWLFGGVLVAVTPMTLFLAGVINPSSLEIASAVAFWSAAAIIVTERAAAPPVGLVAIAGISALVFELTRSLSPLWLAASCVLLLCCGARRTLVDLLGHRSVRGWLAVDLLGAVAALWWIVSQHATDLYTTEPGVPSSVSGPTLLIHALKRNEYWVPTMIGIFGWFDAHAPIVTYVVWYAFVALLVGAALLRTTVWRALVIGCFGLAVLVVPAVASASHAHAYGYLWNGRDTMPFALGLPILAAATLGTSGRSAIEPTTARRGGAAVAIAAAVAQFGGFYEALRRWSVGVNGSELGFLRHPAWQPAILVIPALVLELLAVASLSGLFFWGIVRADDDVAPPARAGHGSEPTRR